ncbi:21949_t:CDS:1, partial [Gigaspora rosea]
KENSELTREIGEERDENPYKKNSQGPEEQEATIVEQDVSIVEAEPSPDTAKT